MAVVLRKMFSCWQRPEGKTSYIHSQLVLPIAFFPQGSKLSMTLYWAIWVVQRVGAQEVGFSCVRTVQCYRQRPRTQWQGQTVKQVRVSALTTRLQNV